MSSYCDACDSRHHDNEPCIPSRKEALYKMNILKDALEQISVGLTQVSEDGKFEDMTIEEARGIAQVALTEIEI